MCVSSCFFVFEAMCVCLGILVFMQVSADTQKESDVYSGYIPFPLPQDMPTIPSSGFLLLHTSSVVASLPITWPSSGHLLVSSPPPRLPFPLLSGSDPVPDSRFSSQRRLLFSPSLLLVFLPPFLPRIPAISVSFPQIKYWFRFFHFFLIRGIKFRR